MRSLGPSDELIISTAGSGSTQSRRSGELSTVGAEQAMWSNFAGARTAGEFCRAWLNIQCSAIAGAEAGLLLLKEEDGRYATAAVWPDPSRDVSYLSEVAQKALVERRGAVMPTDPGAYLGYPIDVSGRLHGVVAIHIIDGSDAAAQAATRQLLWGTGWMESMFHRHQGEKDKVLIERSTFAMDILAGASEHRDMRASALEVANELAARLDCRRVSISLLKGDELKLAAISHSTTVREKVQIVSGLLNAMDEAFDQHGSVSHPPVSEGMIDIAHRDLARTTGSTSVATVLLTSTGRRIGAITLEREGPDRFTAKTLQMLEAVGALIGPLLDAKAESQKLISGKIADKTKEGFGAVFGPKHPAVKLVTAAVVLAIGLLTFMTGEFRISAKAVVEGAVQRAAVAPFDGFLSNAPVRAGDVVQEGAVLATLDDRDLKLEAVRWQSELEQQTLRYNEALGQHDRAAAGVYSAAIDQAKAQLNRARDMVERSVILAPFAAVIVSGDLRQQLGSPVEKGKLLFELALLDSYRVILKVDERDISYVKVGERGQVVLTGLSSATYPFHVKAVTPVAIAADGINHFRVEADVEADGNTLRPGMEGVGKIEIGEERLIWIWTRSLIDWARLTLWTYWP